MCACTRVCVLACVVHIPIQMDLQNLVEMSHLSVYCEEIYPLCSLFPQPLFFGSLLAHNQ